MSDKALLVTAVENLEKYTSGNFKPTDRKKNWGLCNYILPYDLDCDKYFRTWNKFSGSCTFPVEGSQYEYQRFRLTRHNVNTCYGQLRMELAIHVLKEIKAELGE